MTDRAINFTAPMVRALISGTKTMTRVPLKPQPYIDGQGNLAVGDICYGQRSNGTPCWSNPAFRRRMRLPASGDRLWVRETWNVWHSSRDGEDWRPAKWIPKEDPRLDEDARSASCVDYPVCSTNGGTDAGKGPWRSSARMPGWASRLTLIVTDVRVERLQDISTADAIAEGIRMDTSRDPYASGPAACWWASAVHDRRGWNSARAAFGELWSSQHGPNSWAANPWVAAISFETHRCNIDAMPAVMPAKAAADDKVDA